MAKFWGAAELTTHRFLDPVAVAPLLGGLALIVILWIYQYRGRRTLLTLRPLASTIPLAGIVLAVCAAAASVSTIGLTAAVLAPHYTPLHLGLLYLPELGGAVITAIAFGAVFSTRFIHYYALIGMAFLALGILVIRRARGRTGRGGGFPGPEHGGRGRADLAGHRGCRRPARREPYRAGLPWPQRAGGRGGRQRRQRGRGAFPAVCAHRACPRDGPASAPGLTRYSPAAPAISATCRTSGLHGNRISSSQPASVNRATVSATLCAEVRAPAAICAAKSPRKL